MIMRQVPETHPLVAMSHSPNSEGSSPLQLYLSPKSKPTYTSPSFEKPGTGWMEAVARPAAAGG